MDPWRRIAGGDTTSKDYQQGEIFESAILDEGQKNGFYANLRAKIVKGHRKVKLDLSIADQKLSCNHGCSKL